MRHEGICRVCGREGSLGEACTSDLCRERGLHLVTPGAAAHIDDVLLGVALSDKYVLVDRIGAGGFGRVYLALQRPLGRKVAVKVITGLLPGEASLPPIRARRTSASP